MKKRNGAVYEKAIYNICKLKYGDLNHNFYTNFREKGKITQTQRELDIVIENKYTKDWTIIECKNYSNSGKILSEIERLPTKLKNFTGKINKVYIVSSQDFSQSEDKTICSENFQGIVITQEQAEDIDSWYNFLYINFNDPCFHINMQKSIHAMHNGKHDEALELMGDLPYEEWLYVINQSIKSYSITCTFVKFVAKYHFDDAWRYNAIQILDDNCLRDVNFIKECIKNERNGENIELLQDIMKNL